MGEKTPWVREKDVTGSGGNEGKGMETLRRGG